MRQSAFTILTPVRPHQDAALADLLVGIGDTVAKDRRLGLSQLDDLHYASFSLVPGEGGSCSLLFEGNIDGSTPSFLRQLLDAAAPAVDDIYGHCEGYPPQGGTGGRAALQYLLDHDIGFDTFYVAWPGHSVDLVRREDLLCRHIQAFLDAPEQSKLRHAEPSEVHRRVVEEVRRDPGTRWALQDEPDASPQPPSRAVLALVASPLVAVLLWVVAVAAGQGPARRPARIALLTAGTTVTGVLARLRLAELADDRLERDRSVNWQTTYAQWSDNLRQFRHREDVQGQNHLASIADVKPGRFRWLVLRTVLLVIQTAATLGWARGSLAGITSIHFARWAITPDRRRLIFLSNFDGSWENYLGDFVDLAAKGLTAVWTNTCNDVGFPTARWLLLRGARDEARFKAFARRGMVRTLLWYSAYPTLSVADISANRAIRQGLRGSSTTDDAEAWCRRL